MEPIKSIAIPSTRKRLAGKTKRVGHPEPLADNRVSGSVGPARWRPEAMTRAAGHIYGIGQRLQLVGGGRNWARAEGVCKVTALLPHESGPLLYRVQSELENYERVVAEADLAPAP